MTMIKTTTLHYPIQNFKQPVRQVVAMGFFDGVHLGHQAVIKRAKAEADALGVPLAVLTYDPHPSVAFKALTEPLKYLTVVKQKAQLLETLGVSEMYKMQFTSQLAGLSPQVFVDEVLMQLNPVAVVAGFDHLYGSDKNQANMANLAIYAKARFDVIIVPEFDDLGLKIGSSKIRSALCVGDMQTVNRQLGRIYHTTGIVVHGEARGRELGFPTANVLTPELEWLPGIGIYAVKISIAGRWHIGMASIGRNVTFGDNRPITVEINILDFNQAIYGEDVTVAWHHHLRGEVKFNQVDDLITQLEKDKVATRTYFETLD
ncbi:riboflavin biosynthesis protein RibF [Leuconostoc citreum]|uniref:riboflavin biosynthesis protein RibF n=1 Tax=Leuconostoc citreum TaxID=33964 RepID=UPI00024665E9|nr:riboflavin biosynthesis protein RibF [Leuconostoc citreum]KAF0261112.1 riboflavin biosynthesis protein RibF [Leuconostoc citreum]MBA5938316.1 riboflavin biosynthesis protein RibF [Leuconostoc citreum]MBE4726310.1 riboflavin biosynthesis protein RibF [Leuconostoc citreum]MCT3069912.1 riboflavin biosynthesis protein RibF [Leuconostoc citreum]CCF26322.1 Riboflavin biosynthesis protein RibF [Leuconostoc citreum LBAE C11]